MATEKQPVSAEQIEGGGLSVQKYSVGVSHLIPVQSHWLGNQWDTAVYRAGEVDAEIARLKAALRWCLENGVCSAHGFLWMNPTRFDTTVEPPMHLAPVIAEAVDGGESHPINERIDFALKQSSRWNDTASRLLLERQAGEDRL